jgi:hypothetical protein
MFAIKAGVYPSGAMFGCSLLVYVPGLRIGYHGLLEAKALAYFVTASVMPRKV